VSPRRLAARGRHFAISEPRRRWRRWDDWPLRLAIVGVWLIAVLALRLLSVYVLPAGRHPVSGFEKIIALNSIWWMATLPAVAFGLACWLAPRRKNVRRGNTVIADLVCFRIVSRGRNADAVAETVHAVRTAWTARPLFRYRIEVVTDEPVALPEGDDVVAIVVPPSFTTPSGTKYKARALQYALEASDLPPEAWILHLDEESHPTSGVMGGLRDFIVDCDETGVDRVGQGCILYHRQLDENWFLTLADSLRTGDDVSRFYLQYRLGVALFGMHGSFIVVRNRIAQESGFDVGPEGSITEDAWWALGLLQNGVRFAWVDGFVEEQAPRTVKDFVYQRRRWYSGLWKVALYAPAPWWGRTMMALFMTAWTLSCIGIVYTFANLFLGLYTNVAVAWLAAICFGWYMATYVYGLHLNLRFARTKYAWWKRAVLYAAQVLLMPLYGVLEATGVFFAMVKPERGFHVIEKPARARRDTALAPAFAGGSVAGLAVGQDQVEPLPALRADVGDDIARLPPLVWRVREQMGRAQAVDARDRGLGLDASGGHGAGG